MTYYPIFTDLHERRVLLIGGGVVAERKAEALLKAGANIHLVTQKLSPCFQTWLEFAHNSPSSLSRYGGKLTYLARYFSVDQLENIFLVVCATDDATLNIQVFEAAERLGIFCNSVDNMDKCSFIVPAVIDRDPIQVAVSSGGVAPVLTRDIRQKIEMALPNHIGKTASLAGRWRQQVKEKISSLTERRRFWENFFTSDADSYIARGNLNAAEQSLQNQLQTHCPLKTGEATLVGAGPGDPGLLTIKALQAIQAADVVLYDALVSAAILDLVRKDAVKVDVGKRAFAHKIKQEEIHQLLIKHCQEGKRVVRLKGGDSFVFGRGAEECEALNKAGINFSVIPGITAALGVTAYAGIPLTHRDYAQTSVFITGHLNNEQEDLKWPSLAQANQTLVVYMGTIKAKHISTQLIQHGRDPHTPVAIISHGTLSTQIVRTGKLKDLAELSADAPPPTLIVIGEVVTLHEKLDWFHNIAQQAMVIRSPVALEVI